MAGSKASPKKTPRTAKKAKSSGEPQGETNLIRRLTVKPRRESFPEFSSGDTLNVYIKVKEGDKERVQLFKGTVIKVQGSGAQRCFTVRKVSAGVGVEKTFPFSSPALDRIELVAKGKVRRARLFYLRNLEGRAAKIVSDLYIQKTDKDSSSTESAANEDAAAAKSAE